MYPIWRYCQTGDYKFDLTPVTNQPPDLQKMARLGAEGVLCLMSDSTNAERPIWTKSGKWVGKSIRRIFDQVDGRIIFATFASNISRMKPPVKQHCPMVVKLRSLVVAWRQPSLMVANWDI